MSDVKNQIIDDIKKRFSVKGGQLLWSNSNAFYRKDDPVKAPLIRVLKDRPMLTADVVAFLERGADFTVSDPVDDPTFRAMLKKLKQEARERGQDAYKSSVVAESLSGEVKETLALARGATERICGLELKVGELGLKVDELLSLVKQLMADRTNS